MIENNEIIRIYGTEFKENTKKLLVEADLADMIPSKKCRIAIKPNLVSASEASWGATTHTEILAGIIEYLQERGYNNLVIAEGSWYVLRSAATTSSRESTEFRSLTPRRTALTRSTVPA